MVPKTSGCRSLEQEVRDDALGVSHNTEGVRLGPTVVQDAGVDVSAAGGKSGVGVASAFGHAKATVVASEKGGGDSGVVTGERNDGGDWTVKVSRKEVQREKAIMGFLTWTMIFVQLEF